MKISIFLDRIKFKDLMNGTLYLRRAVYDRSPIDMGVRELDGQYYLFLKFLNDGNIIKYNYSNGIVSNFDTVAKFLKSKSLPIYEHMDFDPDEAIVLNTDVILTEYEYIEKLKNQNSKPANEATVESAEEVKTEEIKEEVTETVNEDVVEKPKRTRKKKIVVEESSEETPTEETSTETISE